MALRVSSGGSGILIPCRNLGRIAGLFERMIDRGPVDSLLSFIFLYQPEFKNPDADIGMELHPAREPYLVYKHNILRHIGLTRSIGGEYSLQNEALSSCNSTSMDSDGMLQGEYFDSECREIRSIVSPCGLRETGNPYDPPSFFVNEANWHPWS